MLGYLLKTGLDQVFRKEIANKVQEGIQAGHFIILLPWPQLLLEFGVSWVDRQDQDDPQHRSNDGCGHVIHHGSCPQAPTGFSIQARQPCIEKTLERGLL